MNWEQKLEALQAISTSAEVRMRRPGDWYVFANMEHAEGTHLLIGDYGNGKSPEEAIEEHWKLYGNGEPFRCGDKWLRDYPVDEACLGCNVPALCFTSGFSLALFSWASAPSFWSVT